MALATIHIHCPFCEHAMSVHAAANAPARENIVGKYKCPKCDSLFKIQLKTLRGTKGKRFREQEAVEKAARAELFAKYEADNDRIALALLAQPGCTCGTKESLVSAAHYGHRKDGLEYGGVGVRDGHKAMPYPPKHRAYCPLRTRKAP